MDESQNREKRKVKTFPVETFWDVTRLKSNIFENPCGGQIRNSIFQNVVVKRVVMMAQIEKSAETFSFTFFISECHREDQKSSKTTRLSVVFYVRFLGLVQSRFFSVTSQAVDY